MHKTYSYLKGISNYDRNALGDTWDLHAPYGYDNEGRDNYGDSYFVIYLYDDGLRYYGDGGINDECLTTEESIA